MRDQDLVGRRVMFRSGAGAREGRVEEVKCGEAWVVDDAGTTHRIQLTDIAIPKGAQ